MKITVIFICFLLMLCGCEKSEEVSGDLKENSVVTDDILRIGIYKNINWNPYNEENEINKEALDFIYEPLYRTDSEMNLIPVLAEFISVRNDKIIIKLKENVKFHDGSDLTSQDVVFSANQVIYGNSENIMAVKAIDKLKVEIYLKNKVAVPEMLLDFPIIKNESEKNPAKPNGTGIFIYDKKSGYDSHNFTINKSYHRPVTSSFSGMKMIEVYDYEQIKRLFEIGETDIIHIEDLSFFSPRVNAGIYYYTTNELVCVGFNVNKVPTGIRKAVYYGTNRKKIVNQCFKSEVEYTDIPLIPGWNKKIPEEISYDIDRANNELIKTDNFTCELNILVENNEEYIRIFEMLKKDMNDLKIECKSIITENMKQDMLSGNYDAFIGSCRVSTDMNMLFKNENIFGYYNDEFNKFASDKSTIDDAIQIFLEDIPVVPICFKKGAVSICSKIKTESQPLYNFVWNGFESWKIKFM